MSEVNWSLDKSTNCQISSFSCLRRLVLIEHIANAWGDLLVLLIVFCKIDKLTLLNIKLINTLSTFRRYQDSRERGKGDWHWLFTKIHFDIDCLYHRQGNKQKQVAVHQFKIPINQDTKFIKKSLSISKYLYPFKRFSTPNRRWRSC